MEGIKFRELGQPSSYMAYLKYLDNSERFSFSSFEENVARIALAWADQGDISQRIQGYMSLAPFVGYEKGKKEYLAKPSVVLQTPEQVLADQLLNSAMSAGTRYLLAQMVGKKDYKGGLELRTDNLGEHASPILVPALGTRNQKLVLFFNRCAQAPAYTFLFAKS
jgi:hypothetical protein